MSTHYVTIKIYLEVEGTLEDARAIGDKFSDSALELINRDAHCGDPECCPEPPRPDQFIGDGYTIVTITDEP